MLLSLDRYLSSRECGEMRYLRIFLDDALAELSTAARQRGWNLLDGKLIFTLSISMVWELVPELGSVSSWTECRKNFSIELVYALQLWTKRALTEIAERSATELHGKFSAVESISGSLPERRHRMILQMRMASLNSPEPSERATPASMPVPW